LRIWIPPRPRRIYGLPSSRFGHYSTMPPLMMTKDGSRIVSPLTRGEIEVFDINQGRTRRFPRPHLPTPELKPGEEILQEAEPDVRRTFLSPSGKRVAVLVEWRFAPKIIDHGAGVDE